MESWLQKLLTAPDATPMWLSSYQLLIHFQGTMNEYGMHYDKKTKRWDTAAHVVQQDGYSILSCAASFMASVKAFGKCLEFPLTVQNQMPWGTVFRSWQRCLLLAASPSVFQRVDEQLHRHDAVAIKKVTTALKQCPAFLGVLG